ncbi:T-box protein H15 [Papilio xuthus]|uniref:T-box protein H15 n=1 Tax=Papilio xuthus TaxID=66420 RepID=A0A194PPS3_PAPXU|nr:T-box protein H15 [Papilio xuthus]
MTEGKTVLLVSEARRPAVCVCLGRWAQQRGAAGRRRTHPQLVRNWSSIKRHSIRLGTHSRVRAPQREYCLPMYTTSTTMIYEPPRTHKSGDNALKDTKGAKEKLVSVAARRALRAKGALYFGAPAQPARCRAGSKLKLIRRAGGRNTTPRSAAYIFGVSGYVRGVWGSCGVRRGAATAGRAGTGRAPPRPRSAPRAPTAPAPRSVRARPPHRNASRMHSLGIVVVRDVSDVGGVRGLRALLMAVAGARPGRMLAEEGRTRATDFSIAAIMARSAAEPRSPGASSPTHNGVSSRQSSPASLSSAASSCRSPAPDEDVEVDVEQCSDGERDASDHAAPSPAPSSELGERDTPSPARPLPATSCNCEELLTVDCQLETKELWDKFHDLGTEMIITKTGR